METITGPEKKSWENFNAIGPRGNVHYLVVQP